MAPPTAIDVYPTEVGSGLRPVIFYIHGGGWHLGSKASGRAPCQALSKVGYVCVSTTYRLSNPVHDQLEMGLALGSIVLVALALAAATGHQMLLVLVIGILFVVFMGILWVLLPSDDSGQRSSIHPDHIRDVAQSFRWTKDHIAEYGGNPQEIYVMGHSAGGHLAALLATNFNYLKEVDCQPADIQACIGVSGVYSDVRMKQTRGGTQLLHSAFGRRQYYYDAFPVYNVSVDTPPFLLINAGIDVTLKRHTLDFHYMLKQNGIFSEVAYFDDRSHINITKQWDSPENEQVIQKVKTFIEEVQAYRSVSSNAIQKASKPEQAP